MAKDGYEYDDRNRGYDLEDYDYVQPSRGPEDDSRESGGGGERTRSERAGARGGGGRAQGRYDGGSRRPRGDEDAEDSPQLTESPAAEREVIGNVLVQPDTMRYAHGLAAEDFTVENHRVIWRAFVRIVEQDREITSRAIVSMCGENLPRGGRDLVEGLADRASAQIPVMIESVEKVLEAARRRRLVEVYDSARRQAARSTDPVDAIVAKVATQTDRAALGERSRFMSGRQAGERLKMQLQNPGARIPTGIPKLDSVLGGGLAQRRMLSIIAKPKIGKTTFVSTVSYNLSMMEVPHLVISLERSDTDMEWLQAARHLGVSAAKLEKNFKNLEKEYDDFVSAPHRDYVQYHHAMGNTLDEIRYAILHAKRMGCRVFLLDYFQIVERPAKESVVDHLSRVAQTLANLTSTLEMASVVTAQSDIDGLPRDCKTLWHAASTNFVIRRAQDQADTWLENIGSNHIGNINVGKPNDPALMLDESKGPHFRGV